MACCFSGQVPSGFGRKLGVFVFIYLLLATKMVLAAESIPGGPLMIESNHIVATGQFEPGTNWQAVAFEIQAKGRYLEFNALSSQDGGPFASVAELELLDATGNLLDPADWKIAFTDSEKPGEGAATNAVDGNSATCWNTQDGQSPTAFPHRIVLDLGRSVTLKGFRYLPRQGDTTHSAGSRILKSALAKT